VASVRACAALAGAGGRGEVIVKTWLLKLHRWVALVFALPLVFVLATGLVLSFEPLLIDRAVAPGNLTASRLQALLAQHDPGGQARALSYRSYDNTVTIGGGRGGGTVVDVATGEAVAGPSGVARVLVTVRRIHETLLVDAGWLVIGATAAMLVLACLGVLMGWPRFANTLWGWHAGTAWLLLPLVVLSPLTGLFLAAGITFTDPPPAGAERAAPPPLAEAVRVLGAQHDLSSLVWIRPQGGRLLARLAESGAHNVYAVTRDGAAALPRNWPRLWHEGNFAGPWSALLNIVASIAMIGLLVTGPWIWLRRRIRRRTRAARAAAPA
jgi:uncharacterized iron-regulated membrane protein